VFWLQFQKYSLYQAQDLSRSWLVQLRLDLTFPQTIAIRLWSSVQLGVQPHLYGAILLDTGAICGLGPKSVFIRNNTWCHLTTTARVTTPETRCEYIPVRPDANLPVGEGRRSSYPTRAVTVCVVPDEYALWSYSV